MAGRQPKMGLEPHRLVFVDETGTTTKMTRLRGRCRKGRRLKSKAPFGHWKTQTFVAGLRCYGLTAPFVVDRPMNRRIFETGSRRNWRPRLIPAMSSSSTISPRTKARRSKKQSAPGAHGSCSCHPTVPTSTRSKWPFPSSRHISEQRPCEPSMNSGKRSATSAPCSQHTNAKTTSKPQDMDSHEPPML
jgi:hypothetical protein